MAQVRNPPDALSSVPPVHIEAAEEEEEAEERYGECDKVFRARPIQSSHGARCSYWKFLKSLLRMTVLVNVTGPSIRVLQRRVAV